MASLCGDHGPGAMRVTLAFGAALLLVVACGGSPQEESATPTPTVVVSEETATPAPTVAVPEGSGTPVPMVVVPEETATPAPTVVVPEETATPAPTAVVSEETATPAPMVVVPEETATPTPTAVVPEETATPAPTAVVPEETATPVLTPLAQALAVLSNRYDPYESAIAVITLDFQTLRLKAAYLTYGEPCDSQPPVRDEEVRARAGAIFAGEYAWEINVQGGGVSRVGDFVVLRIQPSDFGGVAVSDPCTGEVLFAGIIVWNGFGRQLYPVEPIPPDLLERTSGQASPPQSIDVASSLAARYPEDEQARLEEAGLAAWDSVLDLNLVGDLASAPYTVLVLFYPGKIGAFEPAAADWVIFVHRAPTR
ncbi:MAG: hypothetical protein MUP14_04580 [Dehalococcoidia bacterium]|nr:hypothetical protein [Dehalococcoidia bacterium]